MVNKKTDTNATVIIKTQNSDKYLYEVLESVKDFSEIIVVDYNSNDDSVQIANEYKAKIIYRDKNDYSNLDSIVSMAQNDWVFVLKQNEIVPSNLLNKISKYIDTPSKNKNITAISKKSFYLNKEIKLLRSKSEIRLFKKDLCTINYNFSIELNNKKSKIHYINKNLKAENEYIISFVDNNILKNIQDITDNNKYIIKSLKDTKPSIVLKPCLKFLKYYLLKGGIFEGRLGFLFCKMKYIEDFILQVMILENNFKGEKYDI